MDWNIFQGDSKILLSSYKDNHFDACITDPPYGMGIADWDKDVPPVDYWSEILRTLKPGAFCISFCSPQLYHRLASNIEEAGFIVKDMIQWIVSTKMVKTNKLKPAHEPICVAQKPYDGNLEINIKTWGVGNINITKEVRIPWEKEPPTGWVAGGVHRRTFGKDGKTTGSQIEFGTESANTDGRYPSNVVGEFDDPEIQKYFYAPRATRKEKDEYNDHPTVKPIDLMEWLIRIFSPENGLILDPFMGSGTTGIAALNVNRNFVGIDLDKHYVEIAKKRIESREKIRNETLSTFSFFKPIKPLTKSPELVG